MRLEGETDVEQVPADDDLHYQGLFRLRRVRATARRNSGTSRLWWVCHRSRSACGGCRTIVGLSGLAKSTVKQGEPAKCRTGRRQVYTRLM